MFNKKRGQNTAEYAIVIALVVGAAIAMQTYVRRSMQGGVKFAVDKLNTTRQDGTAGAGQYEPYYLESSYDTTKKAYEESEETKQGGEVVRSVAGAGGAGEKETTREGYQKIKAYKKTN